MPVGFTATPTGPSPTTGAHPAGITAAGRRAVVHGRMTSPGRILRIDQDDVHRLLASDLEIDDIVFAAFVARREIPRGGGATGSSRIVGSRHSGRASALVNYLRRQRVGHQWIDLDDDASVAELIAGLGVRPSLTPVVVSGQAVLRNPTIDELASHLGRLHAERPRPVRLGSVSGGLEGPTRC